MTPAHLNELADRVEKLTGGCRETDAEIMQSVYGAATWSYHDNSHIDAQIKRGLWDKARECHPDFDVNGDAAVKWRYRQGAQYGEVASYTSSLDAALTLVRDDRLWKVETKSFYSATVGLSVVNGMHSPAIALTAAALRDRAHLANQERNDG